MTAMYIENIRKAADIIIAKSEASCEKATAANPASKQKNDDRLAEIITWVNEIIVPAFVEAYQTETAPVFANNHAAQAIGNINHPNRGKVMQCCSIFTRELTAINN